MSTGFSQHEWNPMPDFNCPPLGSHMSIAGGYYKAVDAASKAGCDVVQIFTKNNNQWKAKPLTEDDHNRFSKALSGHTIKHPISHSSYLINLASAKDELYQKSINSLVLELERAEFLGLEGVVLHPGSYVDGAPEDGIQRIIHALKEVLQRTAELRVRVLLENTAGQGTALGWQLEQLKEMITGISVPDRLGVCIDTCHLFAAGYPIQTRQGYEETVSQLESLIGLDAIKAFHVNDSKRELGSRVDRHEHIGRGCIGSDAFRWLLQDKRFQNTPMYLETAKGEEQGEDLDVINLRTLRELAQSR